MRDINFRAKPRETFAFDYVDTVYKEEDSVYGNLIYDVEEPFIVGEVMDASEDGVVFEFWLPVKPKTVGQDTGLKDKNGVKIYEGDHIGNETTYKMLVAIEKGHAVVKYNDQNQDYTEMITQEEIDDQWFYVLRNIHDEARK